MPPRMRGGQEGIDAAAAEHGFYRMHVPGAKQPRWAIACTGCETISHHGWPLNTPPDMMAKNMRNAGWELSRRGNFCPACQEKEKEGRSMAKTQLGPDPKIARKIYAALDEHFDEVRRIYRAGWSDEKISKEIDTAVDVVIRIRRDAYGELAEDPAIAAIKDDIELARMQFADDIAKLTAETNQRLADLAARMAAVPALKKAIC